jgi:DNA (cytosine-5)-methyltransferase 1
MLDNTKRVNSIELCAGYAGIQLGLRRCIPGLRTIAYSEIEEFACSVLASRMEGGQIDLAPIWSNLKTFPFGKFRGLVDILSGGYPCPGFSAAGKRRGKDDPRHLWPWIADGIKICEPRLCFFENVEGHISLGLSTVVSDLEEMGYKVSWGIFSAAEVGAPHQRKRVFILAAKNALADAERLGLKCEGVKSGKEEVAESAHICSGKREDVAHGGREGLEGQPRDVNHGQEPGRIPAYEDGSIGESRICFWPSRPGQQQFSWEPPRTVGKAKSTMGGGSYGSSRRMGDAELRVSCDNRTDELILLGNGVVPATVEVAFRTLLMELMDQS